MLPVIATVLGICIPALLLAAAVRRWIAPVSWPVVGAMLALVALFLGKALLTPAHLPVPVDEIVRGYPYKGVVGPVAPRNPLTNDTVKQMLPWMDETRRQLFAGRIPAWNPYAFAGYPLLGNGQSAPFSPFFLATLFVPLPKQLVAMAGLKLFVAMLFTFLAARREGATRDGAFLAAVVFAFSVFQTVYLYYPLTAVTALLPAVIVAVQRCFDRPGFGSVALTAIVGAAVLAGGHPESALHLAVAATAFLILEAKRRGVGTVLLGAALAIALSAVAWLPVAEQALHSARLHEVRAAGRQMTPSLPLATAAELLSPDVFGHPARGDWHGFGNYSMVAPTFLGLLPLLLLLVAVAVSRDRRVWAFALFALLSFLVAMNWSPLGHAINALPGMASTANDRLRVLSVFFAALAIGVGAARAVTHRWAVAGVAALLVILSLRYAAPHVVASSHLAALAPLVTVAAIALFTVFRVPVTMLMRLTLVACCLELFLLNIPFNALAGVRYYKPELPILQRLQAAVREQPGRVVGFDWTFLPNASVHYRVEDIRGSDPMAFAPYVAFFHLVEAADPNSDVKRVQNVQQPGLDFLGVRYLLAEPGQDFGPPWRLLYQGPDGNLFENAAALPRFFAPEVAEPVDAGRPLLEQLRGIADFRQRVLAGGIAYPFANPPGATPGVTIRQESATSYTLDVDATRPAFLASSIVAAPGWRITREGRTLAIHTVNGAFLGCIAPAGHSRLHVRYQPRSIRWGGAITALAAVLLLGGAVTRSGSFVAQSTP